MVHRKTVARLVDQETITMGDYTVEIKPAGGEEVSRPHLILTSSSPHPHLILTSSSPHLVTVVRVPRLWDEHSQGSEEEASGVGEEDA
jgi:hypothetical protein